MDDPLYPPDLIPHLRAEANRLGTLRKPRVWPPIVTLPEDDILKCLLNVCYHAGLLREESRLLSFCVVYIHEDESTTQDSAPEVIPFAEPAPFNEQQLRRLAPATDPHTTAIAVRSTLSAPVTLEIIGLLPPPRRFFGDLFIQGFNRPAKLQVLTIRCVEPGTLKVGWGDYHLLELRGGRISPKTEDCFRTGLFADFLNRGASELFKELYPDTTEMGQDERLQASGEIWQTYTDCLRLLLSGARQETHGALILMVPESASIPDCLRLKYQCDFGQVWELLVEALRLRATAFAAFRSSNDETVFQKATERVDTLQEHQSRGLHFLARLAAVDGALLITDHFRLLGFGVEVHRESEMDTIKIAQVPKYPDGNLTPGGTEPIERYGTRHRSAFRFCEGAQNCGAFILSQDGGVKAVRCVNGEVMMWRSVLVDV